MASRREALYGKGGKSRSVSNAETEGKEAKPKLTGGDRAEADNPDRKPPRLGGK